MAKFIIGKEPGEEFLIHREIACSQCPLFFAAFNNDFLEGTSSEYRMDDVTPRAFRMVMSWLYSKKFPVPFPHHKGISAGEVEFNIMSLIELWILADRICLPELQKAAFAALRHLTDESETYFHAEALEYITENTGPRSELRTFAIATGLRFNVFAKQDPRTILSPELINEVPNILMRLGRGVTPGNFWEMDQKMVKWPCPAVRC